MRTMAPGDDKLFATLTEYLQLEHKFQPRLNLPAEPEHGEVSSGARDGAVHVMRCLKVWYELSVDTLVYAVSLLDRFLTKMKVRPCHMPCITVSCMNIAIERHAAKSNLPRSVSIDDLVSVSQSTCTSRDVQRMSAVIRDKCTAGSETITLLSWLTLYRRLLSTPIQHHVAFQESDLMNLVEIVLCDAACANARVCELAFVVLFYNLEKHLKGVSEPYPEEIYNLFDFAVHLQTICHMTSPITCLGAVRAAIARYETRATSANTAHRQRLVWRLSERTRRVLRPTDRLTSLLPTIQEQHLADTQNNTNRPRSGSESSENEETSDWPRSPVLPVYCDN